MCREIWEEQDGEASGGLLKVAEFVMSWDAFGKLNKQTHKSITDMVGNALPHGIPKPTPGDASPGSRISGWRNMYNLLDSGGWIISRDCTKLIECIPTLVTDMERNTEDVLKVDYSENYIGDDAADSARYGLQHELGAVAPPREEQIAKRLAEITFPGDPLFGVKHSIVMAEENKKIRPVKFGRRAISRHKPVSY